MNPPRRSGAVERKTQPKGMAKGEIKIVIPSASDVAGWYLATLKERGA
jgi:hypothetical protein